MCVGTAFTEDPPPGPFLAVEKINAGGKHNKCLNGGKNLKLKQNDWFGPPLTRPFLGGTPYWGWGGGMGGGFSPPPPPPVLVLNRPQIF